MSSKWHFAEVLRPPCGANAAPLPCLFVLLAAPLLLAGRHQVTAGTPQLPADTTITIRTEGSNLEFVPGRIALPSGTRATIRYINDGTLPHNLVVVQDPDDIDTLGQAAYDAAETGYVPLAYRDRLIAWSELASPGQTVEITFTVPPPGEYTFVCLFSGHYNMMLGTLRSLRTRFRFPVLLQPDMERGGLPGRRERGDGR